MDVITPSSVVYISLFKGWHRGEAICFIKTAIKELHSLIRCFLSYHLIIKLTRTKNNTWEITALTRNCCKEHSIMNYVFKKWKINPYKQLECQKLNWQPRILSNMPQNASHILMSYMWFHSQHAHGMSFPQVPIPSHSRVQAWILGHFFFPEIWLLSHEDFNLSCPSYEHHLQALLKLDINKVSLA